MSKVYVDDSEIEGKGVFASVEIEKGEKILEIDDSRVVTENNPLDESNGEYNRHCDYLAHQKVVLMQPPERYINHSCDPNSYVKTVNGVRYVFALRNIQPSEEITYDYCVNSRGNTLWECSCGSPYCRHLIHSDFFHLPIIIMKKYVSFLDNWFIEENKNMIEKLNEVIGNDWEC